MWNDILEPEGSDNLTGIELEVLYAERSEIEEWPDFAATPVTDAEYAVIDGDFVFKDPQTQCFRKLYITTKRGEIRNEKIGPDDSSTFKHVLEGFHPGGSTAIEAFIRKSKNKNLVFIVKERTGKVRMLGSKTSPARMILLTGGSGKTNEGENGYVFNFESEGHPGVAPQFTGQAPEEVTP